MAEPNDHIQEVLGLVKSLEPAERAYVRRWFEHWIEADGFREAKPPRAEASTTKLELSKTKQPRKPYRVEVYGASERDDARNFRPDSIRGLLPRSSYDDK
jgi:hypothetical protein